MTSFSGTGAITVTTAVNAAIPIRATTAAAVR